MTHKSTVPIYCDDPAQPGRVQGQVPGWVPGGGPGREPGREPGAGLEAGPGAGTGGGPGAEPGARAGACSVCGLFKSVTDLNYVIMTMMFVFDITQLRTMILIAMHPNDHQQQQEQMRLYVELGI